MTIIIHSPEHNEERRRTGTFSMETGMRLSEACAELRGAYGRKGQVGGSSKTKTNYTVDTPGWRGGFTRSGAKYAVIKNIAGSTDSAVLGGVELKDIDSVEKWFAANGIKGKELERVVHSHKDGMFTLTYKPKPFMSDADAVVRHTSGMEGFHKGWGMSYERFEPLYGFPPEDYPDLFDISRSGSTVFPTKKHRDIEKMLSTISEQKRSVTMINPRSTDGED